MEGWGAFFYYDRPRAWRVSEGQATLLSRGRHREAALGAARRERRRLGALVDPRRIRLSRSRRGPVTAGLLRGGRSCGEAGQSRR